MTGRLRFKISFLVFITMCISVSIPVILLEFPLFSNNLMLLWTVITALMVSLTALAYFTIIPHLVANLGQLSALTDRITKGDLSNNGVEIHTSIITDEIDQLAISISQIETQLRELVQHLKTTSLSLAGNAKTLNHSTTAVDNSTSEVANSMAKITEGAQLQNQLVLQASNLIIQIAAGIEHTTRSAEDAALASKETFGAATLGSHTAALAIDKIRGGFEKIAASSSQVYELTTKLDEIGKIVEIITKIANQTNMLALNATIEAARAGEYGRGFTVVAEEIRKLAASTSQSADQISARINQFKEQADGTSQALMESTQELIAGQEDMNSILASLENIQITAQKGVDTVTDISKITKGQLEGAKEMVDAISNISDLSASNDRITTQVNAATAKQIESVRELTERTTELTRLSLEIQHVTNKFKLGNAPVSISTEFNLNL